jgi:hypothetical protein
MGEITLNCQFCCCTSSKENVVNVVNKVWICDMCMRKQAREKQNEKRTS